MMDMNKMICEFQMPVLRAISAWCGYGVFFVRVKKINIKYNNKKYDSTLS